MGIALALVWHSGHPERGRAIRVFGIQFLLNLCWTFIFFNQHQLGLAFGEIILLWLMIATNIVLFYRINTYAGILLIPYLAWVSFASVLNYAIMQENS